MTIYPSASSRNVILAAMQIHSHFILEVIVNRSMARQRVEVDAIFTFAEVRLEHVGHVSMKEREHETA